ncbi:FIP1[III]-like protein [Linum perenne]
MEDFLDDDDDYGDLYADVEVQATSAIYSATSSARPYSAPKKQLIKQDDKESKINADKVVSNSERGNISSGPNPANNSVYEASGKSEAEEGSESEDDGLNIVLNDEEGEGVAIPHASARSGDGGYEEADGGPVGSGLERGGDEIWRGNGVQRSYNLQHRQHKEKRLYPSDFAKENGSSSVPSHSLKHMRSNSDNNRFMQHNEANTDQVSNGYPMANSAVYHGGYGYSLPWYRTIFDVNIDTFEEKRWNYPGVNMSDFFNFGFDEDSWRQYCTSVPKGRAIEVEDSGVERLPTMDQTCPDNWESDVVIQIKLQECEENSKASGKVDLSNKSIGDKASRSCELSTDDVGEVSLSIGPNEGQMSMGSAEGSTRSSNSMLETNKFSPQHDNSERAQISDSDEHHPRRNLAKSADVTEPVGGERDSKNVFERNTSKSYHDDCETEQISDECHPSRNRAKTDEVTEPVGREKDSKNEFEKNVSKTDQHRSNSVSSHDDKSHLSLTLSCSESDTEPSGESCYGVYRRSSLETELQGSVASGHNTSKTNDRKQADSREKCMTDNSLLEGRQWSKEERYRRVSEHQKCQDEHDQSTKCRLIDGGRQIKYKHDLDLHKRKDSSYFRANDFRLGDGVQRTTGSYVEADYRRHTQNTHYQSCRCEADIRDKENRNHSASRQDKSFRYQHIMDVDRNYGGRELSPYVKVSPMPPRKYSSVRERQVELRRKTEQLQFGKRSHDVDSKMDLPKHRYDSLDKKYESHSPMLARENNAYERVLRHDDHAMHVDHPWHEEEEVLREHWNDYQRGWNYDQDPNFKSHTRSYTSNQGRWHDSKIPTRNSKYGSRMMEKYSRLREEVYDDAGMYDGGFAGNYVHRTSTEDDYTYFDDQHQFTKRRCVWRSRFHQAEEPIPTPGADRSYFDRTSSCYRKTLRHDNLNVRYNYDDIRMNTADIPLEEHGYETIREEYRDNFVESNLMYRCDREKMVRTYINDPVDVVFGEVKPSGKHSTHGSLPFSGRPMKQFLKHAGEPKSQKLSVAPLSGIKANRRLNLEAKGSQDVNTQVGNSPAAEQKNNESDIEEGQIIAEEPVTQQENKRVSATTAPRSNTKKKALQDVNAAPPDTAANKVYDEQWLKDRLVKMEKRRERFKEATIPAPEKVTDHITTSSKPQVDALVNTIESKQERPARKRRWAGS